MDSQTPLQGATSKSKPEQGSDTAPLLLPRHLEASVVHHKNVAAGAAHAIWAGQYVGVRSLEGNLEKGLQRLSAK